MNFIFCALVFDHLVVNVIHANQHGVKLTIKNGRYGRHTSILRMSTRLLKHTIYAMRNPYGVFRRMGFKNAER